MAVTLIHYRFRNDDGSESTATWIQNEDTPAIIQKDTNFRIRFSAQNDTSNLNNLDVQLQYNLNGAGWINVSGTSNVVRSSASPNVADQANLTQQLTAGTGAFEGATAFDEANGICGGTAYDVAATEYFEHEFCCQVRSADVVDGDTIELRSINSDSGAAWTTYNVTATLYVVFRALKPAPSDAWGNLADQPPTIDLQSLGTTPKTATPPADPWGNLADSVSGGRQRIGWGDSVAFQETAALTAQPSADSLNNWSDLDAPTIYKTGALGATPPADGLNNWADDRTIDKQDVGTTPLEATPPADALSLADQAPTVYQTGTLTATPPADALSLADQAPTIFEFGFLTAALPVDPWGTLADQAPTIDLQVVGSNPINVTPPADSFNLWADAPTSEQFGYLNVSPSADGLNLWGDARAISQFGYHTVQLPADPLNNWADDRSIDKQDLGTTPINVPLSDVRPDITDALAAERRRAGWVDSVTADKQEVSQVGGNLSDARPAIGDSIGLFLTLATGAVVYVVDGSGNPITDDEGNYITADPGLSDHLGYHDSRTVSVTPSGIGVVLPADGLNNWADTTAAAQFGYLSASPSADSLNNWADDRTVDLQIVGVNPITVQPPADGLNNWNDSAAQAQFGYISVALPADARPALSDQADFDLQIVGTSPIEVALPADSVNNWADTRTVSQFGYLTATPAADSLNNWGDLVTKTTSGEKSANLPDALNQWADSVGITLVNLRINVQPPADTLNNWADAAATSRFGYLSVSPPADTRPALSDQVSYYLQVVGVAPPADSLNNWTDSVASSRFGYLNVLLADDLNLWADAVAQVPPRFVEVALDGSVSTAVSLNGRVIPNTVELSGKVEVT